MTRTLVFGGARSGKSLYAEKLALTSGKRAIYLATAQAGDAEMQERIQHHKHQRPAEWLTVEEPLKLGEIIRRYATPDTVILVDCLTLWLSNLLFAEQQDYPETGCIKNPKIFVQQRADFLQSLDDIPGDIVIVSNEVGMGIIPQGAISRWFVDEAGRLNQAVAAQCEQVVWVAAGLPLFLKGAAHVP